MDAWKCSSVCVKLNCFYFLLKVLSHKGYDGALADAWSCGVILYVLMAGYLPFDEMDLTTLYSKAWNINMCSFLWLHADEDLTFLYHTSLLIYMLFSDEHKDSTHYLLLISNHNRTWQRISWLELIYPLLLNLSWSYNQALYFLKNKRGKLKF